MSNTYVKVTIEKKWRTQEFDFISLKSSSPGQFLGNYSPTYADRTTERGRRGVNPTPTAPRKTITWNNNFFSIFFHVKLKNIKFLQVSNMWDFSLFIEQDISDKKYIAFSEFLV